MKRIREYWLHQAQTTNTEKNTRRFGNVKQFTKIVRSVLSSMVDTYENGNFNLQEIDAQEAGLTLIGPENGHLTRLLEALFGWSSTFWLNVLYHDVFGKFFLEKRKGPVYTYVFRNCIFNGSPLLWHLTGLLICIFLGKNIERMIVNKMFFVFISKILHSEYSYKKL